MNHPEVEAPHAKSVDDVRQALQVDPDVGLSANEAARRLELIGPNRIEEDAGPTRFELLARQFKDVLIVVLLVAALISGLLLGDWLEAGVIVAIVLINAAIGFTQESRAADAAEGLKRLTTPVGKVLRAGSEQELPTEELVPGDVVIIETGDRIFADARLVESARLQTDESELTGESTATHKTIDAVSADSVIGDRESMVFAGTVVVAGHGRAIVTATGRQSEIGQIASMLEEQAPPTPLQRELTRVGGRLTVLAGLVAVAVLVVGLVQGRGFESMFLLAVALAVAAIPEGLPAVVGITLGRGVQTMARRNAIVRRMPAVEALGAVTVICTDKTGTLTRNEIAVQELRIEDRLVTDPGELDGDPRIQKFAALATLCNDARMTEEGWKGDPTEIALMLAALDLTDAQSNRANHVRIDEVPFDSSRKRMTTLHRTDTGLLIAMKGAPEVILPRCSSIEAYEGSVALDGAARDEWLATAEDMAARGLRTLGIAYREVDGAPGDLLEEEEDFVLVALVAMSDSIRPEAKPAVEEARGAGVSVVMITGDHEVTATAIANDLDLLVEREVMSGQTLHQIDEREFTDRVQRVGAFARVDPADKVRIVEAWQDRGEIVAMTGDGVNDAPALRRADIGVGMGSGTDVARDASDIVLADDNFATIVAAVRGGRTIFSNLRKVITFLLAANVSEVVVVFVGFLVFSSLGDPLLATQILWVNLVTDGLPAVALGFDPPDHRVMQRPPNRKESLLDRSNQISIGIRGALLAAVVLAAFAIGVAQDLPWELTRTFGFTVLVLVQLTYVYALRIVESGWRDGLSGNRLLMGAVLASTALQVLVVATPIGNRLFSTEPMTPELWGLSFGLSMLAGLAIIGGSTLFSRLNNARGAATYHS